MKQAVLDPVKTTMSPLNETPISLNLTDVVSVIEQNDHGEPTLRVGVTLQIPLDGPLARTMIEYQARVTDELSHQRANIASGRESGVNAAIGGAYGQPSFTGPQQPLVGAPVPPAPGNYPHGAVPGYYHPAYGVPPGKGVHWYPAAQLTSSQQRQTAGATLKASQAGGSAVDGPVINPSEVHQSTISDASAGTGPAPTTVAAVGKDALKDSDSINAAQQALGSSAEKAARTATVARQRNDANGGPQHAAHTGMYATAAPQNGAPNTRYNTASAARQPAQGYGAYPSASYQYGAPQTASIK